MNLIEGLQEEIDRVNEIINVYDSLPKNAGAFASLSMKISIDVAKKAMANGDTIRMIGALSGLKEYEL